MKDHFWGPLKVGDKGLGGHGVSNDIMLVIQLASKVINTQFVIGNRH